MAHNDPYYRTVKTILSTNSDRLPMPEQSIAPTYAKARFARDAASLFEPMKTVAKTPRNHRELILNYFRAKKQFSSGVVEGLNNKVKATVRKSYGFRTFRITDLALYHVLGKLPEPELTHTFY